MISQGIEGHLTMSHFEYQCVKHRKQTPPKDCMMKEIEVLVLHCSSDLYFPLDGKTAKRIVVQF